MVMNPEDLYADLPPDATVDGYTVDEANPGWVEVSFSDGRKATLPQGTAESLPQTPAEAPPVVYGAGQPGFGPPAAPPPPPPGPGGGFGQMPPGMEGAASLDENTLAAEQQAAALAPAPELVPAATKTASGVPSVDYGEVVAPGSPGGFAPYSQTESADQTSTSTVDSPDVLAARLTSAQEE